MGVNQVAEPLAGTRLSCVLGSRHVCVAVACNINAISSRNGRRIVRIDGGRYGSNDRAGTGGIAGGRRRPGPVPALSAGGLRRREGQVSQPGAPAWPDRPAFRTGAVMVDVLVDHVAGGFEQVHELERELIARLRCWSVHLG
jgi:hypothetical protein